MNISAMIHRSAAPILAAALATAVSAQVVPGQSGILVSGATDFTARSVRVFDPPSKGHARPPLWINVSPNQATAPFTPANIQLAYGFNALPASTTGAGQTIAIVDAYGSTTLLSDVNKFCAGYNGLWTLPSMTLGTGNGQLNIVNYPAGSKPAANAGWALETSLDVEWAHAIAPQANIMLVVAADNSYANLMGAVQSAAAAGANVVSMSWGGSEFSGETGPSYDGIFSATYPAGVTFVASSGDNGESTGVEWPAASPYVVGVGGTTLTQSSSGVWSETAWSGSGGGLSAYETIPVWQGGWNTYSTARGVPDVAYDANPSTGVYVYCSSYQRGSTWFEVGGTSAGAPQWAALIALSGYRPTSGTGGNPALYTLAGTAPIAGTMYSLIESGSNGSDPDDKANANGAYCLVTGLGSPAANNLVPALGGPQTPDFSMSVTPSSQSVNESGTATYTVTITSLNGFSVSDGVTFSVSSTLPSGVTAAFSLNPSTTGSSTMTVTTSSASPGTYTLTITGTSTSGTLNHTATATLVVVAPDFSISATPSSQTVSPGNSTTYKATITPSGGFTDTVSFTATGLPSGAGATFSPATVTGTGSSTMTVTTTSKTPKGSSTLTITGKDTSGSPVHTTTVTLSVSSGRGGFGF